MPPRYLLVGNPTARSGKAKARIERALEAMRGRGWTVDLLATLPEGRTVGLVRDAVDEGRCDQVIYLGGDGTFAEVAKGLLAAREPVPLGMLPSGTANDLGKSFGISAGESALERNLDVVGAGWITHLDAGRVERLDREGEVLARDLFFDCAGWGMQPDILAIRNEDRNIVSSIPLLRDVYAHQAVYAGAAISAFLNSWLEPTLFEAEVEVDGETHHLERLSDLVVNGVPVYGGSWVLDRLADPDDGVMELIPFRGRREMLARGITDLKDVPIWQDTEVIRGRDFHIRLKRSGRRDISAQIDGEEWTEGRRFRVIVIPGALPLITDEAWVPPWKIQ